MEFNNLTEEQMALLYKLADFIEENDLVSELRTTPNGPFLIYADTHERDEICAFIENTLCVEELPCEVGFADEHLVCDCCGKVFCTTPDSAFWKKNWLVDADGEVFCEECVTLDMIVAEVNHKFDAIDSISTESTYTEVGYNNYCLSKYGVETIEETKLDYETIMNEVSNYEFAVILLVDATPFEVQTKLFVK